MSVLDRVLKKFGVSSVNELNAEEKRTYKDWENALIGRKITDPEVQGFLEHELETAIESLTTKSLKEREDTFLKMKIEFIRSLQFFLSTPDREKAMVEKQIEQVLDKV